MEKKSDVAEFLFHQGTNFQCYDYFGCHEKLNDDGSYSYYFRVWAPNAQLVELISSFSSWENGISLDKNEKSGIWTLVYQSKQSLDGALYKYRITSKSGVVNKGDPFAKSSKGLDDGASIICHQSTFVWEDENWLIERKKNNITKYSSYLPVPINIYEVHSGSFIKHEDDSYYTYRELADVLVPYVKTMGYTHVEFLPLAEFPYDRSWGYQVCGFYAPSSRYGTPDDFRYMINLFHKNGIGVLLDWVPAHFPKDSWGLYEFDGGPLYEYQGKDRQESPSWGTRFFDLGRTEIQSFLISNAMYWIDMFHLDGLRVDAVSSMIYLDYDRKPGEWFPNQYGDNRNLEAIEFFKKLNAHLFGNHPDILMIAEESTSFGLITKPVHEGGLGFNMKWNMGWANDFFDYLKTDPLFRKEKQNALTFPLMYAFSENYVLPVSHDEVVYGKQSLIDKCFGEYEDKFLQFKTALMLQMTYPGKKLLFMGTEYGQFAEWDFSKQLEWFMLDYPNHFNLREYVSALNRFYLKSPMLWEQDFSPLGFEWINADDCNQNLISFKRFDLSGNYYIVVLSFSGNQTKTTIPVQPTSTFEYVFETNGTGEPKPPIKPTLEYKVVQKNKKKVKEITKSYLEITLDHYSGVILQQMKNTELGGNYGN